MTRLLETLIKCKDKARISLIFQVRKTYFSVSFDIPAFVSLFFSLEKHSSEDDCAAFIECDWWSKTEIVQGKSVANSPPESSRALT
jgi:hypothetical protein